MALPTRNLIASSRANDAQQAFWKIMTATLYFFAAFLAATQLFSGSAFAQFPESRYAEVNGVRLHYLIAGQGDPIVLVHGYTQTSHMWLPLIKKLITNHMVIAPDLRGFGRSSDPNEGYTKAVMAQD
jgi:triacylglycerol esterase/lipase EstA (alpha/beta hydrolase family)